MLSAAALAVIGGVNVVGALLAGWLGDRYPKHVLLGLLYILPAIGVRRLLRGVADGDHNADLLRGNGPAEFPERLLALRVATLGPSAITSTPS